MSETTTIVDIILDVYRGFKSMGYDPMPTFFAAAAMLLARERWVRPITVMKLNREEAVALRNRYKNRIMLASAAVAGLSSWAVTKPVNGHEYVMWACWIVGHTAAASLLYDYLAGKDWVRRTGSYVAPKVTTPPDEGAI